MFKWTDVSVTHFSAVITSYIISYITSYIVIPLFSIFLVQHIFHEHHPSDYDNSIDHLHH